MSEQILTLEELDELIILNTYPIKPIAKAISRIMQTVEVFVDILDAPNFRNRLRERGIDLHMREERFLGGRVFSISCLSSHAVLNEELDWTHRVEGSGRKITLSQFEQLQSDSTIKSIEFNPATGEHWLKRQVDEETFMNQANVPTLLLSSENLESYEKHYSRRKN